LTLVQATVVMSTEQAAIVEQHPCHAGSIGVMAKARRPASERGSREPEQLRLQILGEGIELLP
jgi:hypothetical protein